MTLQRSIPYSFGVGGWDLKNCTAKLVQAVASKCLTETVSRVCFERYLCCNFQIKQMRAALAYVR